MMQLQEKSQQTFRLSFLYALRELRSGFSGFSGFLFCLALGVGGIGIVGSFSEAIRAGLVEEGQVLLGGDVEFALAHRHASVDELIALKEIGRVSEVATLRAMVSVPAKDTQSLIEIKATDDNYPLYGKLKFEKKSDRNSSNNLDTSLPGISVESTLLARLQIGVGEQVKIGDQMFVVTESIKTEPDRMSSGFMIGPRVLMSRVALNKTGLIQPGSLIHWRYRIRFLDTANATIDAVINGIKQKFPEAGWRIRTRNKAAPGINRFVDRLTVFLTLVGFTTLLVGGVGIANSVKSFVDGKRSVIATYKCLGATGTFITRVYLFQIMLVAGVGIAIGVMTGALVPLAVLALLGDLLPVPVRVGIFVMPLVLSALFGLLTAFAFAIWPLGRVKLISPSALFRELVSGAKQAIEKKYFIMFSAACLGLGTLLIMTSIDRLIATWFVAGATVGFATLGLVAIALKALVKKLPLFRKLELRMAISNLHRPGAATTSAVLSLGLGLTLLVTLLLIDKNLVQQLSEDMPNQAPSFFFVDIQKEQIKPFEELVHKTTELDSFTKVPMLRGRIVKLKKVDVAKISPPSGARWVLRGDRGITYSDRLPKGSTLVTGDWWSETYSGPPLVSFTHGLAELLGLAVGDTITVNILGRNITAMIANTRAVEWRSFGINFVMVFAPHALKNAPHSFLSTVTLPEQEELKLLKSVSARFANVTAIRVREVLEAINGLLEKLIMAIRAASSLSFVAAIVVLAGAISAGRRERTYDAVVLKTLGATRRTLLYSYCLEYGILGLCSAVFALLVGSLGAYLVVEYVLDARFVFYLGTTLLVAVSATVGTVAVGLFSSWRILGEKPATILRSQN